MLSFASPRRLAAAAGLAALGCTGAPAPVVVWIPRTPPDDFHDGATREALDALDAAAELPPEAMMQSAAFLGAVHRKLHASFATGFLVEFEARRPTAELRGHKVEARRPTAELRGHQPERRPDGGDLVATIDMTMSAEDGRLVDLRLAHSSGHEGFDRGAIAAVLRAAPFGRPPPEALAEDGRAHLGWRFHRRGDDPCSVRHARLLSGTER